MKIAIISDSHDHLENLRKAIEIAKQNKAEALIHCGDFCAPFIIDELAEFSGEVHCVFGNIDDRYLTTKKAEEKENLVLYGNIAKIQLDNKKIFFTHFPDIARAFALSGEFDAVFHGHTHEKNKETLNNTLLLNPGEIMGRLGNPSLAIYNTETNDAEFFDIE